MPNWAYSKVTLSGNTDTIVAIKNRLATPYTTPWAGEPDWKGNPAPAEQIEGDFLLWNIIKPDNLDTYLERDKKQFDSIVKAEPDLVELNKADNKASLDNKTIMAEVLAKMNTGQDWYHWNVRNWGTKWEIGGEHSQLEYALSIDENTMEMGYRMESAWSPPVEAIDKLAEQYPDVTIVLSSIDESDCFAMSAEWQEGERMYETDLKITHELGMALRGYCNLECCE